MAVASDCSRMPGSAWPPEDSIAVVTEPLGAEGAVDPNRKI